MGDKTQNRQYAIRHNQNVLLYSGVKFSAAGSFAASLVIVYTYSPLTDSDWTHAWFLFITSAYLARLIDWYLFLRAPSPEANADHWKLRFNVGALVSSAAWASSMWVVFPTEDIPHQLLLILTLGGVAGGALASLPYDRTLNLAFQLIIMLSVEIRLLTIGDPFSIEVALFSLFVFGFLLSCGKQVGINYFELLRLKQDVQDQSRSVMQTTERMAHIGYWQWDQRSSTIELSDNLADIWGASKGSMSINACFRRIHANDRQKVRSSFTALNTQTDDVIVEYRMRQFTQNEYFRTMRQVVKQIPDLQGNLQLLGTVQDITDIKNAEEKIYTMAYYDGLTNLANRAYFHEHLNTVIDNADALNQMFGIIYIDLDNFKGVNDSFGHECGDGYLQQFSDHLKRVVRRNDLVARLGGDEFCILVRDISDSIESISTAERCLQFSESPIEIGNHRILPELSIGIATYPADGNDSDSIIRSADYAMYSVKNNGKQNYALYDKRMAIDSQERIRLEADLKRALDQDEFELWYQPQVDIQSNRFSGVEALIRWRHPTLGIVPPDLFINTAERVGMIKEVGEWVLEKACWQLGQWNAAGLHTQVAVNISGDHFTAPGFTDFVAQTIR
ncbi:MAG: putative bifunctional diguanylate cyclase/phosphodiesterase, partial [Granulosicoccus sp.]